MLLTPSLANRALLTGQGNGMQTSQQVDCTEGSLPRASQKTKRSLVPAWTCSIVSSIEVGDGDILIPGENDAVAEALLTQEKPTRKVPASRAYGMSKQNEDPNI